MYIYIYFVFYLISLSLGLLKMAYKVYDQRYVMIPTWIIFHHLPGEHAEITWPPSHCTCLRGVGVCGFFLAVLQDSKGVTSIHILFKAVVGLNNLILVDYLFLSLVNDRYWFVSNNANIAGNFGWFAHTQISIIPASGCRWEQRCVDMSGLHEPDLTTPISPFLIGQSFNARHKSAWCFSKI